MSEPKSNLRRIAEEALAEDAALNRGGAAQSAPSPECVLDADIFSMTLEEHDRRYHGGCYKPGSYCAYRDWLRKYEGVDQILAKGSLGELRQKLHDLNDDIRRMQIANARIIAKARAELRVLNQKKDGSGLSADEKQRMEDLRGDIFRRNEMDAFIPEIARSKMFACDKTGGRFRLGVAKNVGNGALDAFKLIVRNLFAPSLIPARPINMESEAKLERAQSDGRDIVLEENVTMATLAHEFAHIVEKANPSVLEKTISFLDYRCHGERSVLLSRVTGKPYEKNETTRPDKFFNPYCGKDYFNANGKRSATEIISMGLERILLDPETFISEDPEYFKLCMNIIRGE